VVDFLGHRVESGPEMAALLNYQAYIAEKLVKLDRQKALYGSPGICESLSG